MDSERDASVGGSSREDVAEPVRSEIEREIPLDHASREDPLERLGSAIQVTQSPDEFFRNSEQRVKDIVSELRVPPLGAGTRCRNSFSNFELMLGNPRVAEGVRISVAVASLVWRARSIRAGVAPDVDAAVGNGYSAAAALPRIAREIRCYLEDETSSATERRPKGWDWSFQPDRRF